MQRCSFVHVTKIKTPTRSLKRQRDSKNTEAFFVSLFPSFFSVESCLQNDFGTCVYVCQYTRAKISSQRRRNTALGVLLVIIFEDLVSCLTRAICKCFARNESSSLKWTSPHLRPFGLSRLSLLRSGHHLSSSSETFFHTRILTTRSIRRFFRRSRDYDRSEEQGLF